MYLSHLNTFQLTLLLLCGIIKRYNKIATLRLDFLPHMKRQSVNALYWLIISTFSRNISTVYWKITKNDLKYPPSSLSSYSLSTSSLLFTKTQSISNSNHRISYSNNRIDHEQCNKNRIINKKAWYLRFFFFLLEISLVFVCILLDIWLPMQRCQIWPDFSGSVARKWRQSGVKSRPVISAHTARAWEPVGGAMRLSLSNQSHAIDPRR